MTSTIRHGYADTPRGQLHYRVCGEGPPLLLLHSTNLSSRAYLRLMPLLRGYTVYAPDLLGFGYSDPLQGVPDMNAFAQMVIDFMDALGIKRAHVFGLHAGNKIGAMLASTWPQRVERYIIAGMTHSLISDQGKRLASVPDYAHKLRETQKVVEPGLDLRDWALLFDKLSRIWWRPKTINREQVADAGLRELEDEVLDLLHGRQGYGAFYRASWAFDIGAALKRVAAPSLVIELVIKREAHLARQGPVLEKLMADCRSVIIEMSDNDLLYRHPELLAGHMSEFLSAR